jgi:H+-transporting ATPase
LVASSVTDISIAAILAITGVAMTPLPVEVVGGTLGSAFVFAFLMDFVKVPVFRRLGIG